MSNCPSCGSSDAYNSGFTVECINKACEHFSQKQRDLVLHDDDDWFNFPTEDDEGSQWEIPIDTSPRNLGPSGHRWADLVTPPRKPSSTGPNPCGEVSLGVFSTCVLSTGSSTGRRVVRPKMWMSTLAYSGPVHCDVMLTTLQDKKDKEISYRILKNRSKKDLDKQG